MHKQMNPEIVRSNLLRLSKVSLGLDVPPPADNEPRVEHGSRTPKVPAIRYRGDDPGRFFGSQPVGLLMRLMYRQ